MVLSHGTPFTFPRPFSFSHGHNSDFTGEKSTIVTISTIYSKV